MSSCAARVSSSRSRPRRSRYRGRAAASHRSTRAPRGARQRRVWSVDGVRTRPRTVHGLDVRHRGVLACARARAMVGLEALPLPARDAAVRYVPLADALHALPFVSRDTLAALQELRMPIGWLNGGSYTTGSRYNRLTVEAAVRQAHALRRAWDLGALVFYDPHLSNVSALGGCAALHTLKIRGTRVMDVSALLGCSALHTLDISFTEVTDVWRAVRYCTRSTSATL